MNVFAISLKALEPCVQYLVVLGFFCEVQQFPCLYSPPHPPCKQTLFLRLVYQELHICSCCFRACSTVHWFQRSLSHHLLLCWCTQFTCSEYCSLLAACCIGSNVKELSSLKFKRMFEVLVDPSPKTGNFSSQWWCYLPVAFVTITLLWSDTLGLYISWLCIQIANIPTDSHQMGKKFSFSSTSELL